MTNGVKGIRAVYVGINYRYLNPTPSLIPPLLARAFSTHFYGPGFVSRQSLERGLAAYVDSVGGVDIIFASKDFASGYPLERFGRFLTRYAVMLNGGVLTSQVLRDVRSYLVANQSKVVCFLTDLDPHSVPQVDLDNFALHAKFFILWGRQFLNTLGDGDWAAVEGHLQRKLQRGHCLGLLDKFAQQEDRQVISLGFFVSEPEFYWGGLENRPFDVAVPGSAYARRQYFLKALRARSDARQPNFAYRYFFKIADRTPLRPYSRFHLVQLYNLLFQRALSRTKVCVTDGGANNYPVRKFFEIAAAGSLLACPPTQGMDALGFRHNVNYLAVHTADEALEVARTVFTDLDRCERIAAAGRDLAFAKHSLASRTEQVQAAASRIVGGTFAGSYWKDGEFRCA